MSDRDRIPTDDIRHEGERSEHKAYAIEWDHEPRIIIASFDTLTEATEAIKTRRVWGLRFDRHYVVCHGGKIVWPETPRETRSG